jgi:hypothetical protein
VSKIRVARFLWFILLLSICWTTPIFSQNTELPTASNFERPPASHMNGVWSGTLFSNHSNAGSFTITVVITPNSEGRLIGDSTLSSNCLRGAQLQVSVIGANIALAGSDEEGDSLTITGTLDSTGKVLQASYILNGSASGKCETDDGKGQLARR